MSDTGQVTQVLQAIEQGDAAAGGRLLPLVYHELRRLAAQKVALEKQGLTLQATALVHEAYLRLVDADHQQSCHRMIPCRTRSGLLTVATW